MEAMVICLFSMLAARSTEAYMGGLVRNTGFLGEKFLFGGRDMDSEISALSCLYFVLSHFFILTSDVLIHFTSLESGSKMVMVK
jgi:hypothetical protein